MAADYDTSTQRANWTFENKQELAELNVTERSNDLFAGETTLPESRLQKIYMQNRESNQTATNT